MSRSISASVLNNGCKSDDFCSLLEEIGGRQNGKKEYVFEIEKKWIWLFYIEDENNAIQEIEIELSSAHKNYNLAIDLIKKISVNMELLIDIIGEKKLSPSEFLVIRNLSRDNFDLDDVFFIFSGKIVIHLNNWKCAQKIKEYIDCIWKGIINVNNDIHCLEFTPETGGFYKEDEDILLNAFNSIEKLSDIYIYATVRFYLTNKHISTLYDIC